jgi:hypothetical protein
LDFVTAAERRLGDAWEPVSVPALALDGTRVTLTVEPAGRPSAAPRPAQPPGQAALASHREDHAEDLPASGRPAEVAREVLAYVTHHPDCYHADIMAAMEGLGHSRTAANDNLHTLVQLGVLDHPRKGAPYRLAAAKANSGAHPPAANGAYR